MLRMKPNGQIKDHLGTYSKLVSDLADMGLTLADEILAVPIVMYIDGRVLYIKEIFNVWKRKDHT